MSYANIHKLDEVLAAFTFTPDQVRAVYAANTARLKAPSTYNNRAVGASPGRTDEWYLREAASGCKSDLSSVVEHAAYDGGCPRPMEVTHAVDEKGNLVRNDDGTAVIVYPPEYDAEVANVLQDQWAKKCWKRVEQLMQSAGIAEPAEKTDAEKANDVARAASRSVK